MDMAKTSDAKKIRQMLQGTESMNRLMDGLFGHGNWVFDETEDVWVGPNSKGPRYIIVKRGGDWFIATPGEMS